MKTTIHTIINDQRVEVEVSASEVLYLADKIQKKLFRDSMHIMMFAADAYHWNNGRSTPTVGMRKVNSVGGDEFGILVGDIAFLISGTLRRIDNNEELTSISELLKIGYENAYVALRSQAACCGIFSHSNLGKRKITNMQMIGERAYLTLAPID